MIGAINYCASPLDALPKPQASMGRFYVAYYGAWTTVSAARAALSTAGDFVNKVTALFGRAPPIQVDKVALSSDILAGIGLIMSAIQIPIGIKNFYKAVSEMAENREHVNSNIDERNRLYALADRFRHRHVRPVPEDWAVIDSVATVATDMESGFAAMIACEEARTLDNVEGKYLGYRVAFLRDVVLQAGNVASITGKLITHAVSASVGGAAAVVGMGVANIVIGGLSYHVARADVQKSGKVLGKIASVARNLDRCVAQSQETGGVKAVLAERKQYGPGCIEGALRAARYERHVAVSSGIFEAMQVSRRLLAQALNNESKESNELKDAKRRIAYGVVSASCGAATLVAIIVLGANPWLLVGGAVVSLIAGAIWQGYLSHKNRNVAAPDADATMARSRQLDKDVSMTVEMLARRSSEATLARKLVKAVLTDIGLSRKYFALHKLAQYSGNPLIMDRMDRFMERQIRHLVASSGARQRIDAPSDN